LKKTTPLKSAGGVQIKLTILFLKLLLCVAVSPTNEGPALAPTQLKTETPESRLARK